MKKKIIIILLILFLVIFVTYKYVYKQHRDVSTEKVDHKGTVKDILSDFQTNEVNANAKYLDKTIEVSGTISSIDFELNSLFLDEILFVTLKDKLPKSLQLQSAIKIKGRFIGYDALLEELKMDQCVLENY
jgi:hypothetical protein